MNYRSLYLYILARDVYSFFLQKKRNHIYSLYKKRIFNLYKTNLDKNALISYQPASFLLSESHSWYKKDSLYERNRIIAKLLMEHGFNVDVISVDDREFDPSCEYDLIFDIDSGYKEIYQSQHKKPKVILHYTTAYYEFHNKQQLKRISKYRLRTGISTSNQRPLNTINDGKFADVILSMGNNFTKNTFPKNIKNRVVSVPNFPVSHLKNVKRHIVTQHSRNNFLYMASKGSILKGLDLLMEVFSRPDMANYNLYVSGSFENEPELMNYYSSYFNLSNIHKIGWLYLHKREFSELIKKTTFHIFPSCSEGMPGAVVNTMSLGVIPIVTKESGIECDDNEFIIKDNVENIVKTIVTCASCDLQELKVRSDNIVKYSSTLRSRFKKVMNNAIMEMKS